VTPIGPGPEGAERERACWGQNPGGVMPDDAGPGRPERLHIEAEYLGSEVIVVLEGEFDMTGTARFWAHISNALEMPATSITVDARGVTFIDSSSVGALLRARAEADERGVAFRVSEPSPVLRRIAQLAGIEDLLPDE
jgi:anti-sigma B factor antagonist